MPIDWPEPFGLVMIEAMACGTPVIAYGHGSVPEVIEDGVTGFIVHDEEEAIAAVQRVHTLDRGTIRARFDARFSARRMAADYVEIYESIRLVEPERLTLVQ
jgi:glycosyltransferase involved in cell wall biosynthesis